MEFQDYYKILNVPKDATQEEIQRAYRKLARKFHPDINKDKDAEEHFKKINEANEVLKDPEKRKLYDAYGRNWQQGGPQSNPQGEQPFAHSTNRQGDTRAFHFGRDGTFPEDAEFSEFFTSLFGDHDNHHQRSSYTYDRTGRSHEAELTVSLADVYHGMTKAISVQNYEEGQDGRLKPVTKNLQVTIPKGITDGSVIRLAGQGEKGSGQGASGDLLLRIHIAPDPRFSIDGHDLHTVVAVSPWEAALGSKIPVQTLAGNVTLSIPKGSQNGKKFRLRGKGIPKRRGTAGDMFVEIEIRLPEHLSHEEEVLLQEISQKSHFNPRVKTSQKAGVHA